MAVRKLTGDITKDEILDWLDGHSGSISAGLALPLMYKKWVQSKREPHHLANGLQSLVDDGWIEVAPASEPPHLRFTRGGYGWLLDAASQPTPEAAPEPVAVVPPPVPAKMASPSKAAALPAFEADSSAPVWLLPDGSPTEIGLRNQILSVFRELGLRKGDLVNATRLSRYWQELGQRAGNLRLALDVVLRDRYLRPQRDGLEMIFSLTADGESYTRGPLTHAGLLPLAPSIGIIQPAVVSETELRAITAIAAGARQGKRDHFSHADLVFGWLESDLDENDLIHGLDLLYKSGCLHIESATSPVLSFTQKGVKFVADAPSMLVGDAAKRAKRIQSVA